MFAEQLASWQVGAQLGHASIEGRSPVADQWSGWVEVECLVLRLRRASRDCHVACCSKHGLQLSAQGQT